jgi:hypothetical protein
VTRKCWLKLKVSQRYNHKEVSVKVVSVVHTLANLLKEKGYAASLGYSLFLRLSWKLKLVFSIKFETIVWLCNVYLFRRSVFQREGALPTALDIFLECKEIRNHFE